MPFILAGSSLRIGLVAGDSLLITAEAPAAVTYVIGGATITGTNKPGMDSRSLYYGPLLAAAEVIIAAAVSTDFEVVRGLYNQVEVGMIATLTAAEIAAPTEGILADVRTTYMLNVAPFTRYRSDGAALVSVGSGGGVTNLSYTAAPTNGVVTSDTGTDATLTLADGTNAGLMAPAQHTKLAGIETGATADQTGAEMVTAINTELGGTTWQGGAGASVAVQENDVTVTAAATTLDFSSEFDVTDSPAGEANIAISSGIARVFGSVTLTGDTTLNAATHANRLIVVNSASPVTLTLQSDGAGGFADTDFIAVYRQGAGQVTVVQGTATLENTSGMLVATASGRAFIGFDRVRASVWAPTEAVAGAGSNVTAYRSVGTFAAPLTSGESSDLTSVDVQPLTANGDTIEVMSHWSTGNENTSESQTLRFYLNSVLVWSGTLETNSQSGTPRFTVVRVSDTSVRVPPTFQNEYQNQAFSTIFGTFTVSSLSAGCSITARVNRATAQTKTVSLLLLSAVVERA